MNKKQKMLKNEDLTRFKVEKIVDEQFVVNQWEEMYYKCLKFHFISRTNTVFCDKAINEKHKVISHKNTQFPRRSTHTLIYRKISDNNS